jgi:hypothetical protein
MSETLNSWQSIYKYNLFTSIRASDMHGIKEIPGQKIPYDILTYGRLGSYTFYNFIVSVENKIIGLSVFRNFEPLLQISRNEEKLWI